MSDHYRKTRKPCCSPYDCGRRVHTLAYVQRPVCQPCRRRLKNLRLGATAMQRITLTLSRREYDAALAALHEKALEGHRDESGPALDRLDVLDAIRTMERAQAVPA